MASSEEAPKKRKGFVFKQILKPERSVKVPSYEDLTFISTAPLLSAPAAVSTMFGSEREVIAIDCETHALVPPREEEGLSDDLLD